jgi:tetratricopeptide (TPR) repeat protein
MAAFAERFRAETAEVEVLRLLGLFDRPATKSGIGAVRAAPAIPGLTAHLLGLDEAGWLGLDEAGWLRLLDKLRAAGLVAPASAQAPDEVDAHPLVREHFGAELREYHPKAWQAGHARLYEHFKARPEKHQPDTLEEMAPLFQAVFHGCQAAKHQEALLDVYRARLNRRDEFYVIKKLGAFGADLAALASFFEPPFESPVTSITKADQTSVLYMAGFELRALGRLKDAVQPVRTSLDGVIAMNDWNQASVRAGTLSELQLALGEVAEAITLAEQSIHYADRSGNGFQRIAMRTTLADALHQTGKHSGAEGLFREAERLQAEVQPGSARLYSVYGYRYCDLLLDFGRHAEVRDRAGYALQLSTGFVGRGLSLWDIALDHLSLGRAKLMAYEAKQSGALTEVKEHLNQAVDGFRKAGVQEFIPCGLLARVAYFQVTKQYDYARRDLAEVMRIATRSSMLLFECDAHLEYARLELAQSNREAARSHLARAEELVAATGYHRRDKDLAELKAAFG